MTVVQTDKWLLKHYEQPLELCKKLQPLFHHAEAEAIYRHLTQYGMYGPPIQETERIDQLIKLNVWEIIKNEEKQLKQLWNGPNIPIFIFPSDIHNKQLQRDYSGKAGLTFKDKLFLFISEQNSEQEIRALFTHEYNHAARLAKIKKQEKDFILLDHIMMEGLAEHAVKERFGQKYLASWTKIYSNQQLKKIWKELIFPNHDLKVTHPKHHLLLYGRKLYPKMAGYCTGYYLVQKYLRDKKMATKDILSLPSETIAELNKNKYVG